MRLLLINPFPANKNPNPHLIDYVQRAALRVLGPENVLVASLANAGSLLSKSDAVLVFGSLAYATREIKSLSKMCRRMDLPLCSWVTDDPYEIDINLESSECFDWIWANDKASLPFYDSENVSHLPLAADPETHCLPFPGKESHYLYDVSFVGVEFPNRRKILGELRPQLEALETAIIGPNWTVGARFVRRTKISNREAAEVSNRSRIVLNMGRSFDLANTRGIVPSTPGPRTFEVGACSSVQLVTWDQPEIEEYYVPDEELIFCNGVKDIEGQIDDLVANRERRRAIAESSFNRTQARHLYDHRLREIAAKMRALVG